MLWDSGEGDHLAALSCHQESVTAASSAASRLLAGQTATKLIKWAILHTERLLSRTEIKVVSVWVVSLQHRDTLTDTQTYMREKENRCVLCTDTLNLLLHFHIHHSIIPEKRSTQSRSLQGGKKKEKACIEIICLFFFHLHNSSNDCVSTTVEGKIYL